jgi:predicted transcriptional regulator
MQVLRSVPMSQSTVIVRVDEELKAAFADAAKSADRTPPQVLRYFMRDHVRDRAAAAEYDEWFRGKVVEGLADARAGRLVSNEDVEARFTRRRASASKKIAARGGGACMDRGNAC